MAVVDETLEIAPYNPSGWQVFIKTILGLVVGVFIAFLIFIILVLIGGMIQQALSDKLAGVTSANPLLPLILIIVGFIGTFIGTLIIAGIFNLLYPDKYYDMGKMFSLTLLMNVLTLVLFVPLYLIFSDNIDQLFIVLAFHTLFSIFLSYTAVEISTNPNYAAVHLIGTAAGILVAFFVFAVAYKFIDVNQGNTARIIMVLPPVIAYLFLPLFHSAWEKVYYKFYSMGNNFFYIPSLNEVMVDEEEADDVKVDTDV